MSTVDTLNPHRMGYAIVPLKVGEPPMTFEEYKETLKGSILMDEIIKSTTYEDLYEWYLESCRKYGARDFLVEKFAYRVGEAEKYFNENVLPKYPNARLMTKD